MRTRRQELGAWGEGVVFGYYLRNGFSFIGKNVRIGRSEIDLLFEKGHILYCVEVKTRQTTTFGYPEDAITQAKRQRMYRAAAQYVAKQSDKFTGIRIEVAALLATKDGVFLRVYTVDT